MEELKNVYVIDRLENIGRYAALNANFAPGVGELACGTAGAGRMAEPAEIFGIISKSV